MKKVVNLGLILVLTVLTGACGSQNEEKRIPVGNAVEEVSTESVSSQMTTEVEFNVEMFTQFLEEIRTEYQVPGMAVAVVQGDQIVMAEGFGVQDVTTNTPVTPETLFHIGSTNKIGDGDADRHLG